MVWEINRYRDTCRHGKTILSTAKPRLHTVERITPAETYPSADEVFEIVKREFTAATGADGDVAHIIKAPTAVGKTEIYLESVANGSGQSIIAVPTNILKHDVLRRAKKMGIRVMETPSLDEIKDDMPSDVWERIKKLRASPRGQSLHQAGIAE